MLYTDAISADTMGRARSRAASKAIAAIILVLGCLVMGWLLYSLFGPPSRLGKITSDPTEFIRLGDTEESVVARIGRPRIEHKIGMSSILGAAPASDPFHRKSYILDGDRLFVIEYQNGRVVATYDQMNLADNRYRRPPLVIFDPLAQ